MGRRRSRTARETGCYERRRRALDGIARAFALRSPAGLLPVLVCAGCMVGPDYEPPAVTSAASYLEANQASVDTKRQEYEAWWRVFNDPVLDRLIETAYAQNLTLVAAGTRVLQARAELGVAIGDFYPQSQR